jgi:hypothetical protein
VPEGPLTDEQVRLRHSPGDDDPWRLWGPYLSARQWGTVREDYSEDGDAWAHFPFDQAHARAYRWGEDGIAGLTDRYGFLNLAVAAWNHRDDRLKERLFGLTNGQGNHGEDAKEYWWGLDATPTHSWAQYLYRYPQAAFPYDALVEENARRGPDAPEFQLADTGVLQQSRFFDIVTTHAKVTPQDVCLVIEATNHGPDAAPLDLVPQLWFRNTWSWGRDDRRPSLRLVDADDTLAPGTTVVQAEHGWLGRYVLIAEGAPDVLFCDNETNVAAVFGPDAGASLSSYPKDGIGRAVVDGDDSGTNPAATGTKVGLVYRFESVPPGATVRVQLRLRADHQLERPFGRSFASVLEDRRREADEFYESVIPSHVSDEDRHVCRRAFAGLNWGKQLYRYSVKEWLDGDPAGPPAPPGRRTRTARNRSWSQLALADVISMPDEWEYPWFATWDLAFHCVAIAHMDPEFAKNQLLLLVREWAQHPNGQLPAYEWDFGDVNPPVHAWAAWHVHQLDGGTDRAFLVRIFTKLMFNFSWWLNRKDSDGSNLFEGGFLGMDNISVFDRSRDVPQGWRLEQSDATSWMAFTSLSMLRIALELSREDQAFDGLATTFLEHFLSVAEAMETFGTDDVSLWDEADGFFYDVLVGPDGHSEPVRLRSLVGLLPLIAVAHAPDWITRELPDFVARLRWLQRRRPDLTDALVTTRAEGQVVTSLAPLTAARAQALMARLFDEGEFLGPHGIRSLSAAYRGGVTLDVAGVSMSVAYDPGESTTNLFGGNSNWRGPVWFPINVLLIDGLRGHARAAGGSAEVEYPTGSGRTRGLGEVADDLEQRLVSLFRPGADGRRPGTPRDHPSGPLWDVHPTFAEYFDGDTGRGCGASHQTGWTALVAHLICSRPLS